MDAELRRRLARFDRPLAPVAPPPRAEADPLRALLAAGARWCGRAPTGHLRLEGQPVPAPDAALVRALAPSLPPGPVCALDTETTGLESGTGTLVFAVGFACWTDHQCRLVQLFLPEPAGERTFLEAVRAELAGAAVLLSFNGRGFDLPRLRSRLRLQRLDDLVLDRPHLDLLYPARRLVRGWLPDARLKTVEARLLGELREDDLPGEFAPEVYRTLQFDHRDAGLVDVMRHNARDVENLPALVARIAGLLAGEALDGLPAACALAAARVQLDRGEDALAARSLELVLRGGDAEERIRARALRARMFRRAGDDARAAREWEALLVDRPGDLPARIELAKLLEHRLGDRRGALALVLEARALLALRPGTADNLSEALDHRYRRLVRRLGRKS